MVVDVVESSSPCLEAFLLELNGLRAEPAPEPAFVFAANAAFVHLGVNDCLIANAMILRDMEPKAVVSMTCLAANFTRIGLDFFITFP